MVVGVDLVDVVVAVVVLVVIDELLAKKDYMLQYVIVLLTFA